jgi:uncharacterized protein (DUF2336 family)
MQAQRSLIVEVESAIASGSADQRVEALRRITDLFLVRADDYSDTQLDVFDDVISRLAEKIETKARAELAVRLAPVKYAPTAVMRSLARDAAFEVAGPVLSQSNRLTDNDILACATDQDRLLAISRRISISEVVGDLLVTRGDHHVVRSVARNNGARFSNSGYSKLVERAIDDDDLAVSVGLRKDIPKEQFHALVAKASEAVFRKLAPSNPGAVSEVNRVLFELTGHSPGSAGKTVRDYTQATVAFDELRRSGKPIEAGLQGFASTGRVEETVLALSSLCHLPVDAVERVFFDLQADNDLALLLLKAAEMSWPTAKLVLELRGGKAGVPAQSLATAYQRFEQLQPATAKRVIRFYQARLTARETN